VPVALGAQDRQCGAGDVDDAPPVGEQDPALALACVDFAPTLNRLITRLIAGYPAA
jgi:hypothetical protein